MRCAYRVPFHFDRSGAPRYRLTNVGDEPLRGVTFLLSGPGVMPTTFRALLPPGSSIDVVIRGDLARATTLIVRWLRPDGSDYLWRVSF
jgi:hypothetical protein